MKKSFYVSDPTFSKDLLLFETPSQVVKHLEGTVRRRFGKTRQQWMQDWIDLGNGYDDDQGITFVSSLSDYFNVGVIHSDGRQIKCNIFESVRNSQFQNETGN